MSLRSSDDRKETIRRMKRKKVRQKIKRVLERTPVFGVLVKGLRKKEGISARALARELGCNAAEVYTVETSKKAPSVRMMLKWQRVFNIPSIILVEALLKDYMERIDNAGLSDGPRDPRGRRGSDPDSTFAKDKEFFGRSGESALQRARRTRNRGIPNN